MSITDSLYIGISGLNAHGNAISVVGDNIANASTIGFKRERADFSDVLGGQIGSQRLGGGVEVSQVQTLFDQGSIQQTGNPLDLAIQGGGFFQVTGQHDGQTGNFYTRDGRFQLDNSGFAVDAQGLRLQGYAINATGQASTAPGDLQLGARQSPPQATASASLSLHLDSDSTIKPAFDPANPSATSNYSTQETVYDSLGTAHHAQVYMRSQGGGNWEWHAIVDGGEIAGGTKGTPFEIGAGTLTFNTDGTLQAQATTAATASFAGATPNQTIKYSFGDDIASGGTGRIGTTSDAGDNAVNSVSVDGHAGGNLTDIEIASNGKVTGVFDNGQRVDIAQVALAKFSNETGLRRSGDGLMSESATSGVAIVDKAGQNGRGSINQGALEGSNVDISNELVTLIAYQRAFEANAKTVTTADEMMQDVSNLKR